MITRMQIADMDALRRQVVEDIQFAVCCIHRASWSFLATSCHSYFASRTHRYGCRCTAEDARCALFQLVDVEMRRGMLRACVWGWSFSGVWDGSVGGRSRNGAVLGGRRVRRREVVV